MGIIEKISEIKTSLRKKQDKKLALKSKEARAEIRRQKFIKKSRADIEKAKELKKENSLLTRTTKKFKQAQKTMKKIQGNKKNNFLGVGKGSDHYAVGSKGGKSPFDL